MRIFATILLFSSCCCAQVGGHLMNSAPEPPSSSCVTTSFTGSVKRGLPFVQTLGSGLTYQLVPVESQSSELSRPPKFVGWTIRVAYLKNRGDMEREFSENMTPRFHKTSPRDLNTSYGQSVKEIFAASHTVFFATTLLDSVEAGRRVQNILHSDTGSWELAEAHALQNIPAGSAKFTIVDQQLEGNPAVPTGFLGIAFKVEITLPTTVKLTPLLAARAKTAVCPVIPIESLLTSPSSLK